MDSLNRANRHLNQLRQWRNRAPTDMSLQFLRDQFQRQVARPHKQLASAIRAWQTLVPLALTEHTQLLSLRYGVLRVLVDSNAYLYELDRLLRDGLELKLAQTVRPGPLRKVQLLLGAIAPEESPPLRRAAPDTESQD